MLVVNFDPFPVVETDRLVLRQVTEADVNEIYFLRSDAGLMKYIDRPSLKSEEDAIALIRKIAKLLQDNEGINWGICLKENNRLLGTIALFNFVKEHYRCELGYMLHPGFQGKGIAQEALTAVLKYAFNLINLHSIEANVNPGNMASIKLLERNGFVKEAYFRENFYFEGKFLDSAIYSLLCSTERKHPQHFNT